MPKKKYALAYGQPERLEITWNGGAFRVKDDITLTCDGTVIGFYPARSELEKGQEFQLPDGSSLNVRLFSNYFTILYNGQSIQWIVDAKRLRDWSLLFAVVSLLRWPFSFVFKLDGLNLNPALTSLMGLGAVLFALAFLAVGLFAVKRNYVLGLLAFVIVFVLSEMFFDIFIRMQGTQTTHISDILFFMLVVLVPVGAPAVALLRTRSLRA